MLKVKSIAMAAKAQLTQKFRGSGRPIPATGELPGPAARTAGIVERVTPTSERFVALGRYRRVPR